MGREVLAAMAASGTTVVPVPVIKDASPGELDALDPNDLRGLYQAALAPFWDMSTYRAVVAREEERGQL